MVLILKKLIFIMLLQLCISHFFDDERVGCNGCFVIADGDRPASAVVALRGRGRERERERERERVYCVCVHVCNDLLI